MVAKSKKQVSNGMPGKSKRNPTKSAKKRLPPAPLAQKVEKKVLKHPFFEITPKNFCIGADIQHPRDLTRFVKWPKYIRIQRQKRILLRRLKVPAALNQFNLSLNKNQTNQVLRFLSKYQPESSKQKKERLQREAKERVESGKAEISKKKPYMIKYGLNHVTDLVEIKKAKLVVIPHDVDPIELVCWLPTLCRKKDIPYCIIKGKARLGQLVHKKTVSVVAIDNVRREDQAEFDLLCRSMRSQFNNNVESRRKWGGGIMGIKSQHIQLKKEKAIAVEQSKKFGLMV